MNKRIYLKHFTRQLISIFSFYSGICFLSEKITMNHGARILCYHGITESPGNQYSISTSDFVAQIEILKEKYKIISIDQLAILLAGKQPIPPRTLAISFDDGFEDFYKCAFPVLKRFNIPATAFISTGFIDDFADMGFKKRLPEHEFLTWDQIREMSQGGIDIGSHSVSHNSMSRLSRKEIQFELDYSKHRLETELGKPVRGFSYPYGTFRDTAVEIDEMIAESGYSWAVTTINGINRSGSNPFNLRRTVLLGADGIPGFKRVIRGSLDGWIVMQKLGYYLQKH